MGLPDSYVRPPRCKSPGCHSTKWRLDKYREYKETGFNAPRPCTDARCFYTFPHRRGSKWCCHNPNWTSLDAKEAFGAADPRWWIDDPLCFGQRPVTGEEAPF